jgi:hypothetical protein
MYVTMSQLSYGNTLSALYHIIGGPPRTRTETVQIMSLLQ